MDVTQKLELPFILPNQAQKHVTHNEALQLLDALVQLAVLDDALAAPPALPAAGDTYIVAAGATGDWVGHAGDIASYGDNTWQFMLPRDGWRAWVGSRGELSVRHGGSWRRAAPETYARIGINTDADTTNRLSVKSDAVVVSHDDATPGTGDACVKINKSGTAKRSHVQFSTNWSVRAEAGLIGDDNLAIRVSPDGSAFTTALTINTATGKIGVNTPPATQRLLVREDQAGATQLAVSNLHADAAASSGFTLNALGGLYFNTQLYGAGVFYAYSNARMVVGTYADRSLTLRTNTADRVTVHGDGRVSVGTATASAMFAVNGAARIGSYAKADLPSASVNGAGSLVYVSDATGGSIVAFSDGTSWRRISDRSIVN